MASDITGNKKISERIDSTVPSTITNLTKLNNAVTKVQDRIRAIPTDLPSSQPGAPGRPGEPGKPGEVVTSPPQTRIITTPGPTTTVRPVPTPACRTALLGSCVLP